MGTGTNDRPAMLPCGFAKQFTQFPKTEKSADYGDYANFRR
jgi:hypothetical protein